MRFSKFNSLSLTLSSTISSTLSSTLWIWLAEFEDFGRTTTTPVIRAILQHRLMRSINHLSYSVYTQVSQALFPRSYGVPYMNGSDCSTDFCNLIEISSESASLQISQSKPSTSEPHWCRIEFISKSEPFKFLFHLIRSREWLSRLPCFDFQTLAQGFWVYGAFTNVLGYCKNL